MPRYPRLPLASLRADDRLKSRVSICPETVADYAELLVEGVDFPPVVAFDDGSVKWLAAGFHRYAAHGKAGRKTILTDLRQGSFDDALLYSVGENAAHGLRRSNADKQRAILLLLESERWGQRSTNWIAEQVRVDPKTVLRVRESLSEHIHRPAPENPQVKPSGYVQGKDGRFQPARKPAPTFTTPLPIIHYDFDADPTVRDERGTAVPAHLLPVWDAGFHVQRLAEQAAGLGDGLGQFLAERGLEAALGEPLQRAARLLRRAVPWRVCPRAVAGRCKPACPCGGKGWLSRAEQAASPSCATA